MDSIAEDITNRMKRIFTVQSQKMDTIEQRLEAEARNIADALKAAEANINDQQQHKMNDNSAIEMNLKAIEHRIQVFGMSKKPKTRRTGRRVPLQHHPLPDGRRDTSWSAAGTTQRGPR